MEERLSAAGGELAAGIRAGVATVTLNRPSALNALSLGMLEGLAAWLAAWSTDERVRIVVLRGAGGKSFCAGGDIRALRDNARERNAEHHRFFEAEYALDHRIHTYGKPVVAVMDGIVMGGGMGLAQGAALRLVGARTRMAMPETAIGLFPDVGASFFLSRLPGMIGMYLGLTGVTIGAADALYCELADACLAPDGHAALEAGLREAANAADAFAAVRATGARLAAPGAGGGEIEALRPAIDLHFGLESVPAIVASLGAEERPAYREWAARTLERLAQCSPTMLEVTFEQLRRGAILPLAECFRMELNLVHGSFEQGDFLEGIRARIVDKDNRPRWDPASLAGVTPESVASFFAPRWKDADHPLAHL